jgi:hypothetical protein
MNVATIRTILFASMLSLAAEASKPRANLL